MFFHSTPIKMAIPVKKVLSFLCDLIKCLSSFSAFCNQDILAKSFSSLKRLARAKTSLTLTGFAVVQENTMPEVLRHTVVALSG